MNFSDAEILGAIQTGEDRKVLKYLYEKLFPKVKKYIHENSGDSDAAFDIFQDSIMVFYKYVKTNKFDPKYDIAGFVFTVSRNLWINKVAKEKRMTTLPEYYDSPDVQADIVHQLIDREREQEIKRVMAMLGERCEELLRLSIFYKIRNVEICKRMGFSTENAVKTRKYKCMQKLISLIEENPSVKRMIHEI
jgi:RNA polymerase sigma factor (sigma-70 family)